MPEELWTDIHNTVQEMVIKIIPKKKKCKKAKCLSEEALQRAEKKKRSKRHGEKDMLISTQSFKEQQGEIRKLS